MTSNYWSDIVHALTPYVPGEQPKVDDLVKLNTNENPYGPSPKAIEAMQGAIGDDLRLYPDPNAENLKQAAADYYGLEVGQVFVGNGSDEVLAHTFQALLTHSKPILFPDISYSFYPVYCKLYRVPFETVPLTKDFEIQIADYQRENGGIIFPNPNAPTGKLLPLADIESMLEQNRQSVVVVDEAYIDFGGDSAVALVNRFKNLLVTQTLSKSRSLAGLRVGFAFGDSGLIEALDRVKNSFNSYPIDRLAIAGGVASFEDDAYFQSICKTVIESRNELVAQLQAMGFNVLPSAANFVFATCPGKNAAELAVQLRKQGIVVRHFQQPRIEQYLRISIGTPEQNNKLMAALNNLVS